MVPLLHTNHSPDSISADPRTPTATSDCPSSKVMGRLAFDHLHHPTQRQVRGPTQQQMPVARQDMTLQNLCVLIQTNLSHQIAGFGSHLASECRLAILRDEQEKWPK